MVERPSWFGAAWLPQGLSACYHQWEIQSLSGHSAGERKAICLPNESQQKLNDATGQQTKAHD